MTNVIPNLAIVVRRLCCVLLVSCTYVRPKEREKAIRRSFLSAVVIAAVAEMTAKKSSCLKKNVMFEEQYYTC